MLKLNLIIAVLLLCSCSNENSIEKERERLLQTDKNFSSASEISGVAEAYKLFLAKDATKFIPGKILQGLDSIYLSMKKSKLHYNLKWIPVKCEVSASGDLGYTWGNYLMTYKQNDSIIQLSGKYVNVWKKQTDGKWKVIIDIGSD